MRIEDAGALPSIGAVPAYPDIKSYAPVWGHLRVWEGDGWQTESMSWKEGVYLAANLVGPIEYVFTGPDAQAFLSKTPQQPAGGHADLVTTLGGRAIGVSSAVVYSYYYRELISQTVIDLEESEIGNEVLVHWGDYGHRVKQVRATVERFPYLELTRNKDFDVRASSEE